MLKCGKLAQVQYSYCALMQHIGTFSQQRAARNHPFGLNGRWSTNTKYFHGRRYTVRLVLSRHCTFLNRIRAALSACTLTGISCLS